MRLKMGVLIAVLLASIVGQAVLAQTTTVQSPQDTVELVGTIEAINADGSIVVNGVTVTITTAELNVGLAVGLVVKVEGALLPDGRIAAREVRAPRPKELRDNDEIEMIGIVESYDGSTLVVNGLTIDVGSAEINAPIVVGQPIKVHGSFDDDGNLIARETDSNTFDDDNDDGLPSPASTPEAGFDDDDDDGVVRPGEFEITGTLQQVGDGFIVVNGQTISIIGAEIKNTLLVGTLVKLHLSNQNGQLVAREVENARTRSGDDDDDGPGSSSGSGGWNTVYVVQPGDTLSSIALRSGTTVDELALRNNITNTSVLVAGTQLIVPRSLWSDDDDDDNSGRGSGSRDDDDDDDRSGNSGRGSGSSDDDDDDRSGNSGRGSGSSDDDDDDSGSNSGRGGGSSDDDDD